MRSCISIPKLTFAFLSLPALLLVAAITGCGGPDANSPEVKKEIQARAEAIRKDEEQDPVSVRGKGKVKQGAVAKSIKSRLGGASDGP
jgi:hypothetical protein